MLDGSVGNLLNAGGLFHVAAECQNFHAKFAQFLRRLQAALLFTCAKNQVSPHFRQAFGHLSAEADRATGHDGNASAKIENLFCVHPSARTATCATSVPSSAGIVSFPILYGTDLLIRFGFVSYRHPAGLPLAYSDRLKPNTLLNSKHSTRTAITRKRTIHVLFDRKSPCIFNQPDGRSVQGIRARP